MRNPLDRPVTFEDLESVPEGKNGEIVDGELFVSPRPAPRHLRAAGMLGDELIRPFDRGRGGPGGWIILIEPELHLGKDALVPDVAGWRRERMPRLPEDAAFTLAPDWVCEVLSPSTSGFDLMKKLPKYARHGVQHAWIVHPGDRTLQVYRRTELLWTLVASFAGEEKIRAEPFDAIELELAALWDLGAPPA